MKKSKAKRPPVRKDVDLLADEIGGGGSRKKVKVGDVNPHARFVIKRRGIITCLAR